MFPIQSLIRSFNAFAIIHRNVQQMSVPVSYFSSKAKTLSEKAGLPPRPKKPLTPYFRFMKEIRSDTLAKNPNIKPMELVKLIAQKWEKADPETKSRLEREYNGEKEKYKNDTLKYNNQLTPEQREDLKLAREEQKENRERREKRRRNRELAKPKKPATPFLHYANEQRRKRPPTGNYQEYLKVLGEKWAQLTEVQRKPYYDLFEQERFIYQEEFKKWEAKMVQEKNYDVVRNSLVDTPVKKHRENPKTCA